MRNAINEFTQMIKKQLNTDSYKTLVEFPMLLPVILVRNGRSQFRKEFITSYPSFIHTLRNEIPNITASEELLCMLLHLKQSTNDIAAVLGISHKSVNQARYRLRQKINISTQQSLEAFIYKLMEH